MQGAVCVEVRTGYFEPAFPDWTGTGIRRPYRDTCWIIPTRHALCVAVALLICVNQFGFLQLPGSGVHTGVQAGGAVQLRILVSLLHCWFGSRFPGSGNSLAARPYRCTGRSSVQATRLVSALH